MPQTMIQTYIDGEPDPVTDAHYHMQNPLEKTPLQVSQGQQTTLPFL